MGEPNKKAHVQHDHSQPHVPSVDDGPDLLSGSPDITDRLPLYGEHTLFANAVGASTERGAERQKRQEEQPQAAEPICVIAVLATYTDCSLTFCIVCLIGPMTPMGRLRHLFGLRPRHTELIHHDIDGRVAMSAVSFCCNSDSAESVTWFNGCPLRVLSHIVLPE
jgi:hypothetical protein